MDCESDEDVDFCNSPVYQYQKQVGLDNLCHSEVQTSKDDKTLKDAKKLLDKKLLYKVTSLWNFKWNITALKSFLGISIILEEIIQMRQSYCRECLKSLLHSKVFTEEDKDFIGNNLVECAKSWQIPKPSLKIIHKLLLTLTIPCTLAYYCHRILYPRMPWKYATVTDVSAMVTSIYLCWMIVKFLFVSWKKYELERICSSLAELVRIGESLTKQMKKSLRLIQEAELVSRGFTLVSQKSAVSRLEQNSLILSQRQCPELRKQLFIVARNLMLCYKDSTVKFLKLYPVSIDSEGLQNYLALVPLEDYGLCLQIKPEDQDSQKKLYETTDGFSIAALKGMTQLCFLHQSEFLKRLVFTIREKDSSICSHFLPEMVQLSSAGDKQQEALSNLRNHHMNYIFHTEDKMMKLTESADQTDLEKIHVAVHSLDLHLQAALLRIRSLTALIDHSVEKQQSFPIATAKDDQSQDSLLQQIKQELEACKNCWEEGMNRLKQLEKKSENDKMEQNMMDMKDSSSEKCYQDQIKIVKIEDPIIEDEVFEAYIDEEDDIDRDFSWDEFMSPEEKAKKKQEKAEAMRVLTELKSVISVRALEMDKREQIALGKAQGQGCQSVHILEEEKTQSDSCEQTISKYTKEREKRDINEEKALKNYYVNDAVNCIRQNDENTQTIQEDLPKDCKIIESDDTNIGVSALNFQYNEDYNENERESYGTGSETDDLDVDMSLKNFRHSTSLEDQLDRFPRVDIALTSSLAAQAVARSQNLELNVETFGDSDDSDFEYSDTDYENRESQN